MEKVFEGGITFSAQRGGPPGSCHLELYQDGDFTLALVMQSVKDNGLSITNGIASIATDLANSGRVPAVDKMLLVEMYQELPGIYSCAKVDFSWAMRLSPLPLGITGKSSRLYLVAHAPRWQYMDAGQVSAMAEGGLGKFIGKAFRIGADVRSGQGAGQ